MRTVFKLCVYIPQSHLKPVKQAMFAAGAGRIGDYDSCCWQVLGEGQFRPLNGSQPFIGEQGVVETVSEFRVEMVCASDCIDAVIIALKQAHPYEQPAYDVMRVESF